MNIREELFASADKKYAEFQAKLTPTIEKECFIGVRVPIIRQLAKTLIKVNEYEKFLNDLPHKYYDENMLHSAIIVLLKDYDKAILEIKRFLPYIDNWAVCDTLNPKIFAKHKTELLKEIKSFAKSNEVYTLRFAVQILMNYYLDEDFKEEYLEIPAKVISDEYYVNMAIAWFYATALSKQWDYTLPYIEKKLLGAFVHNKTISKARDSFRITPDQKEYLKTLRV